MLGIDVSTLYRKRKKPSGKASKIRRTSSMLRKSRVSSTPSTRMTPLEVEEARSSAFMAICEVGKALHRGQPAEKLWAFGKGR